MTGPLFYCLPAGLDAVLTACRKTRQPMSAADRRALADWLRLERTRVERETRPIDRHHVAVDQRTLDAVLWAIDGPDEASAASRRCRWCGDSCPRWGSDACPLRPRQIFREERR